MSYETTAWVAGETHNWGSQQQHKHLPCFGHSIWTLCYNKAGLQGINSPLENYKNLQESPCSLTAHPGWARLPKAVLLRNLWHANIAQATCGSFGILPFCAFASQAYICSDHNLLFIPTLQTAMVQFLGWGQAFNNQNNTAIHKHIKVLRFICPDLNVCTIQAHLWIKWIIVQIYSVFLQTEAHSLDI